MREYHDYAEKQIANREAIVDELLDALAATMRPPVLLHAQAQAAAIRPSGVHDDSIDGTDQRGAQEGAGTAAELARLRTQLFIQQEEHKALVNAMTLRQSAAQLAPPDVAPWIARRASLDDSSSVHLRHGGGMLLPARIADETRQSVLEESRTVRELKGRMEQAAAEARANQAALAAELTRHMSDMRNLHERMLQLEEEKNLERHRADILADEVAELRRRPSALATTAKPDAIPSVTDGLLATLRAGAASQPIPSSSTHKAAAPQAEPESRAARALEQSQKLLDGLRASGAGNELFTHTPPRESAPPPTSKPPQVSSLVGPTLPIAASATGASGTLPPLAPSSAVPTPQPVWQAPRTKTVWGLMYEAGPDSAGPSANSSPQRTVGHEHYSPVPRRPGEDLTARRAL
jgi:hypothetical protein